MSTDASHQWSHCTGAPNSQAAATANTWNMPGRNSQTYHSMLHFYMCVIFSILFSFCCWSKQGGGFVQDYLCSDRYVYYPERDCVSALRGHPDLISPMALFILCAAFGHNLHSTFSQGTEAHIRFPSVSPTQPFLLHLSKLHPFLQLKSIPRPPLTRSILAQTLPMCVAMVQTQD